MAQGALKGMGAVAAGLIAAVGLQAGQGFEVKCDGSRRMYCLCSYDICSNCDSAHPAGLGVAESGGAGHRLGVSTNWCCWSKLEQPRSRHEHLDFDGCRLAGLVHPLSPRCRCLAVGGAITTAPDMQRYLVTEQHWLTDAQFTSCIALAQAAPGPNVLFVALMGWNVGLNAGGGLAAGWSGWGYAFLGMFMTMLGILLPSTTLTFVAARWGHQNRELRIVRAFKQGMGPIVIALLIATGWLLIAGHNQPGKDWPLWLLTVFPCCGLENQDAPAVAAGGGGGAGARLAWFNSQVFS